jgi:hypothetical protein
MSRIDGLFAPVDLVGAPGSIGAPSASAVSLRWGRKRPWFHVAARMLSVLLVLQPFPEAHRVYAAVFPFVSWETVNVLDHVRRGELLVEVSCPSCPRRL